MQAFIIGKQKLSLWLLFTFIFSIREFKYLGVVLDERLSWNEHVKAIVYKAGRRVGMLGRVRRYITFQSHLYVND